MADIPTRPPAPAPPLPPGWTEHKAPSGSYSFAAALRIANIHQDTATTTTRKAKSRHTRDRLPNHHKSTILLHHLVRLHLTNPWMEATSRSRHKTPSIHNDKYKTSFSVAHHSNFHNIMAHINTLREADIAAAFEVARTTSPTEDGSATIDPSIAMIYRTVRPGYW